MVHRQRTWGEDWLNVVLYRQPQRALRAHGWVVGNNMALYHLGRNQRNEITRKKWEPPSRCNEVDAKHQELDERSNHVLYCPRRFLARLPSLLVQPKRYQETTLPRY